MLLEEDQTYDEGKRGMSYDKTEDCTISHVTVVVVAVIIVVDDPPRKVEGVKEMGVSDHTDHNSLPHLPDVERDRSLNQPQACGGVVRENQEQLTQCEAYKYLRGDADLENQEELVEFFMKVMNRRKEKNWNYAMMRERCESSTVRAEL